MNLHELKNTAGAKKRRVRVASRHDLAAVHRVVRAGGGDYVRVVGRAQHPPQQARYRRAVRPEAGLDVYDHIPRPDLRREVEVLRQHVVRALERPYGRFLWKYRLAHDGGIFSYPRRFHTAPVRTVRHSRFDGRTVFGLSALSAQRRCAILADMA